MDDDSRPLFQRISDQIADGIVEGTYPEGTSVPSTNELAAFYRVNPATAGRSLTSLVEQGALYKRRGLGMYVAAGAREALLTRRRARFADVFVRPLAAEAHALGLEPEEVIGLVRAGLADVAASPSPREPITQPNPHRASTHDAATTTAKEQS